MKLAKSNESLVYRTKRNSRCPRIKMEQTSEMKPNLTIDLENTAVDNLQSATTAAAQSHFFRIVERARENAPQTLHTAI